LTKELLPRCFVCVGGHSASFVAEAILADGAGAIDCVLKGEGESGIVPLLEAVGQGPGAVARVPGLVGRDGAGPPPVFADSLDDLQPARHLLRRRRKYFLGPLDPCASIEFSRGCPCAPSAAPGPSTAAATACAASSGSSRICNPSASRASSSSTMSLSSRSDMGLPLPMPWRERASRSGTIWKRAAT